MWQLLLIYHNPIHQFIKATNVKLQEMAGSYTIIPALAFTFMFTIIKCHKNAPHIHTPLQS
jgi:hypothetical protein